MSKNATQIQRISMDAEKWSKDLRDSALKAVDDINKYSKELKKLATDCYNTGYAAGSSAGYSAAKYIYKKR